MMRLLQGMMEGQRQQTELLREGLITMPQYQRPRSVSDFRRLQLAFFFDIEKPLDVEQRLKDTTDLLKAIRIPNNDQVDMAKRQLKDVARPGGRQKKRDSISLSLGTSSPRVSTGGYFPHQQKKWKSSLSSYSSEISSLMSMLRNS